MAEQWRKLATSFGPSGPLPYRPEVRSGRDLAARKTEWHIQVAGDRKLPKSAYMVALLLPKWLNSRTEEGFPAQRTVAGHLNLTTRAVTNAFGALVARGHLSKHPGKRGYHGTNVYKMELRQPEMANGCSSSPLTEAKLVKAGSPRHRTPVPQEHEATFGQTIKETNKRTSRLEEHATSTGQASNQNPEHEERVTRTSAQDIMREVNGASALNEHGYLRR